ncbi:MAG: hypothetical protein JJU12_05460 [Chlamydiales bacterium]|nr:hypothetical protein [Chlamydiales bacterium]
MNKVVAIISMIMMACATTLSGADSPYMNYQNYNHGYCPGCNCAPCGCPQPAAPPPSAASNPPSPPPPCNPCDPCAPVCGAECGISLCAIGVGIAALAIAAGIIAASGSSSSKTMQQHN